MAWPSHPWAQFFTWVNSTHPIQGEGRKVLTEQSLPQFLRGPVACEGLNRGPGPWSCHDTFLPSSPLLSTLVLLYSSEKLLELLVQRCCFPSPLHSPLGEYPPPSMCPCFFNRNLLAKSNIGFAVCLSPSMLISSRKSPPLTHTMMKWKIN